MMELGDFAAIAAAIIALLGVLLSLVISERRARRESRITREDSYRADARSKLAELLVAAHAYARCGSLLSSPDNWISEGQDRVLDLSQQATELMATLERALVAAELTVTEIILQEIIANLRAEIEATEKIVREVVDSFWESRRPSEIVREKQARWSAYRSTCSLLQSTALQSLTPTVRDRIR